MSSTSSHSRNSSSNDHFSFLPPLIVYDLQSSIPKTDPYKIFRSTSNSIFHDPSPFPVIREEDPEDPLSPLPANHSRSQAELGFVKSKDSSNPTRLNIHTTCPAVLKGSQFSDDSDSDSDEEDEDSQSIRDTFEFEDIRLVSPSPEALEPIYLSTVQARHSADQERKGGCYHDQDAIISPMWKSDRSPRRSEEAQALGKNQQSVASTGEPTERPPLIHSTISSQRRAAKASIHELTLKETREMLENAWKEEHERQKAHELQLKEQRRMEEAEKETSNATAELQSQYNEIMKSPVYDQSREHRIRLSPKTVKAKAFQSQHTHAKGSRSLDSSFYHQETRLNRHPLSHITRIVPPNPLQPTASSSPSNRHRYTVSESHTSIPMNSDLHEIYASRKDSFIQEQRGGSRDTIPLAAFDHTLPCRKHERPIPADLGEPSFLALPESQTCLEEVDQSKALKSDYEIRWDSKLPGFKLWKENETKVQKKQPQQPRLVARIPKLLTGWKMVLSEPKDLNISRHEVVDSRKDNGTIICEARKSGHLYHLRGKETIKSTLSSKGLKDKKSFNFFTPDGQSLSWIQDKEHDRFHLIMQCDGQILASFQRSEENGRDSHDDIRLGRLELNLSSSSTTSSSTRLSNDLVLDSSSGVNQDNLDSNLIPNPSSNLPQIIESSDFTASSEGPSIRFGMDLKNTLFKDSIINSSSLSKPSHLIPNSTLQISYELIVATLFIVLSNKGVVSDKNLVKRSHSGKTKKSDKVLRSEKQHTDGSEVIFKNPDLGLTPAQKIKLHYKAQHQYDAFGNYPDF